VMRDDPIENPRVFADILEPMDLNDKRYARRKYLEKKQAETHNGHGYHLISPDAKKCPTISATYYKIQPDSPMIEHPIKPLHSRILTASEHCNIRHISGKLKQAIVGIEQGTFPQSTRSNKAASHRMLGNSVTPEPFEAIGAFLGLWLQSLCDFQIDHSIPDSREMYQRTFFL